MAISLDAIAAGGNLISLTRDEIASVLCRLAAAQTRLAAHLGEAHPEKTDEDRLLDADEAAQKLGVKRPWLYRRTKTLPFVVRLDGKVLFSASGIEKFIAARRGR